MRGLSFGTPGEFGVRSAIPRGSGLQFCLRAARTNCGPDPEFESMPLDKKLLAAYQSADYVVHGPPELVLKIGEPSPRLDELLEKEGATTAAFLTRRPTIAWRRGA